MNEHKLDQSKGHKKGKPFIHVPKHISEWAKNSSTNATVNNNRKAPVEHSVNKNRGAIQDEYTGQSNS
ncbi:hypothetical protein [Brevibacillus laterosporus]|uniref:hypothetical protein n=1 Tax=Brevibacillus laterosporus TaxID=1465 RepID=UPI0018F87B8F|nr:hypothetical protein [Brevibacillus laterosporus]MBG9772395.1 hypothetical protein [Brevibacillus laterosporus]